ncbi:Uncharacterised protein [Salmonella enterica subsp. arizonae]|uniref:Uncharacterized protein n=1 Tax=Salmonella enterica subsp. arizonae TaxID=59203 RepID=A0A3S5DGH5_SALER|nr:Uncharacterised protein [Salmonella enterica subsp. arizonae]
MSSICVDSFMLENGERYCHVVNKKLVSHCIIQICI